MQTEAFQGCQAHNSFVCYAIETSCSLLSQYLLPNGMCALLLPLLNNTRLEEGLITSPLRLSPPVILCPSSSFPPSSLSYPPNRLILYFLYSPLHSQTFATPRFPSSSPPLSCRSHIISPASAPPSCGKETERWKLHIRLGTESTEKSVQKKEQIQDFEFTYHVSWTKGIHIYKI